MAYLVAQIRKNTSSNNYMTDIASQQATQPTTITSPQTLGKTFDDYTISSTFTRGQVYYFRFRVPRVPKFFYSGNGINPAYQDADTLNIKLLLRNAAETDEENTPPQQIGSLTIQPYIQGQSSQYYSFSTVFTPIKTFDSLIFRLDRIYYDYLNPNEPNGRSWLKGNETTITRTVYMNQDINQTTQIVQPAGEKVDFGKTATDGVYYGDLAILNNTQFAENQPWLKFGYQCRPGSMIVVNKEPIVVGRSGIYQINNGTKITSFMIAAPGGSHDINAIDSFLLDYAYEG